MFPGGRTILGRTAAASRLGQAGFGIRHISMGSWVLLVPVLITSAVVVAFLAFVFVLSFNELQGSVLSPLFSLKNYVDLYHDPLVARSAVATVKFAITTLVVAGLFGLPLAWLVERTDLPGKPIIWTTASMGILIPGFLTAMGWLFLLHPRIGIVNVLLIKWFGLEEAPLPITTVLGMGWVQGLVLAPLFLVIT
ncbi:MAG TPA: hypothetical protein VK457_22160, partial [Chloroflexota bacterium]|nr:hypothetical protein [Chloroflexota bacterium]